MNHVAVVDASVAKKSVLTVHKLFVIFINKLNERRWDSADDDAA